MEKFSIALITDEDEMRGVEKVRLALSAAGYKSLAIQSWQALEIIERLQPALVIANLAGDRAEDLRLCKRLANTGLAPLIVLGSKVPTSQILAFFESGATDYLVRPVNLPELLARVRNILHRTQPPFHFKGTAVSSGPHNENIQRQAIPLSKALHSLAGRLARHLRHRSP